VFNRFLHTFFLKVVFFIY